MNSAIIAILSTVLYILFNTMIFLVLFFFAFVFYNNSYYYAVRYNWT